MDILLKKYWIFLIRRFFLLTTCCLFSAPVFAQSAIHDTLNDFLYAQTQGLPGKVSYSIGQVDARALQSQCQALETFLPNGSRLWGKSTVGIRCMAPTTWTIYVQVHVRVTGNYLVATRAIPAGRTLTTEDIASKSGDLTRLPSGALFELDSALGRAAKNGIVAGQPLREDQLILSWAIQRGQNVKTLVTGSGFSVSSDGKALNNATEGQIVQVRTSSGQVISGIARNGGIVEINH